MPWTAPANPRWIGDRFLLGLNYPWRIYDGDFGNSAAAPPDGGVVTNTADVTQNFADMAAQGVDVVRWFVFGNGIRGINFDSGGLPTGLAANVIPDLKAACTIAASQNIQLVPVLLDYLWLQTKQIVNGVQKGGRKDLILNPAELISNVFRPVLSAFRAEPAIHSWDVINEPENAVIDGNNKTSGGKTYVKSIEMDTVDLGVMTDFVDAVVREVWTTAPGAMVTVGCADLRFLKNWLGHNLDYYQVHFYWEGFTGASDTNALYNKDVNTLGMDRPVVVGEFAVKDPAPSPGGGPALATSLQNWYQRGYAGAWAWKFRQLNGDDNSSIDVVGYTQGDTTSTQAMSNARTEINQKIPAPKLATGAGPTRWFLQFDDKPASGGPWADNTFIAFRRNRPADGTPPPPRSVNDSLNLKDPWDTGCKVTRFVNSFAAMRDIRDTIVQKVLPDKQGHVYITGWRLNPQHDLSDNNTWGFDTWKTATSALSDETIAGLVLRMMQAGVKIRILVWLPTVLEELFGGLIPHTVDHYWLAGIVSQENKRLGGGVDAGIVGLDIRTADNHIAAAHHQKMMVIRTPSANVAYCGGVDMAFTRRDAPAVATGSPVTSFLSGDWQSGDGLKDLGKAWPQQSGVHYESLTSSTYGPPDSEDADLPDNVYGKAKQHWHDQHLKLEGPIVATLEDQFRERWRDSSRLFDLDRDLNFLNNQVIFSTNTAYDDTTHMIKDPDQSGAAIPPQASTTDVQMWRTIPYRSSRRDSADVFAPFKTRGEFTMMAGVANAIQASNELVWICDQYFFSRPLARLLNRRIRETSGPDGKTGLGVIIILPPYADTNISRLHHAREIAIGALVNGLTPNERNRIGIYNLWHASENRGIYCHAKAQTYDGSLLVCGSANMNRRSFTCDTELSVAVLDSAVVSQHQKDLWALFIGTAWPASVPDLDTAGSGATFVSEFAKAVTSTTFLIKDPYQDADPTLPNGVKRDRDPGFWFDFIYEHFIDPCSVDLLVEEQILENGVKREPRLDDIVAKMKKKPYWNA